MRLGCGDAGPGSGEIRLAGSPRMAEDQDLLDLWWLALPLTAALL
jgi:hypothetical protein